MQTITLTLNPNHNPDPNLNPVTLTSTLTDGRGTDVRGGSFLGWGAGVRRGQMSGHRSNRR